MMGILEARLDRIDAQGSRLRAESADELARWLAEGEKLHRQLRSSLPAAYLDYLLMMMDEGARLLQLVDGGGRPRALAVWREYHTTYAGRRLYVDDLVTAEAERSRGHGRTIIRWLRERAVELGCTMVALDSGSFRHEAHRFYFREGFHIFGFHFVAELPSEKGG